MLIGWILIHEVHGRVCKLKNVKSLHKSILLKSVKRLCALKYIKYD